MKNMKEKGQFECSMCNAKFDSKEEFKKNMKMHDK